MISPHIERSGKVICTVDKALLVRLARLRTCDSCASYSVCGLQALGPEPELLLLAPAPDNMNFQPGSRVTIELSTAGLGRLLLLCYLLQPVLMLLGAWLFTRFAGGSDLAAMGGALTGLAVGCFLLWLYDARGAGQSWLQRLEIRPAFDASPGQVV